jgi:glycerol-3-phosphate acyltransferase PlsY
MSATTLALLLCIVALLLGGIPFGLLVGLARGIDVRAAGSGNIGAANVSRLLGRPWGILVFALDALKGLVPAVVGSWLLSRKFGTDEEVTFAIARLLVGLCAILGHSYCPYLGFRGGKGVATSLGVCLGTSPELTVPAAVGFGVWAAGFGLTRVSSVGSLSAALSFPVLVICRTVLGGRDLASAWPYLAFATVVAGLIIVRHRANIVRLLSGTESQFRTGSGSAPDSATSSK